MGNKVEKGWNFTIGEGQGPIINKTFSSFSFLENSNFPPFFITVPLEIIYALKIYVVAKV